MSMEIPNIFGPTMFSEEDFIVIQKFADCLNILDSCHGLGRSDTMNNESRCFFTFSKLLSCLLKTIPLTAPF